MCNVGGGTNRCLAHNPISKFVVKVVTVRTKADESLVNKTLGELSKEGKNLPSPAPDVVKSWVETEKFAAQYDPELSEHDRKIQLNRLERAETENVNGGHFHAWKNLHSAVRSKLAKKLAAGGLVVGMSFSLVGCIANGSDANNHSNGANNSPTSISAPASYGMVVGSGEKVTTPTGSYEKITIDKTSPLYQYNSGQPNPEQMVQAGWSDADGAAAQHFVADYMVKEFIDSSALEGGDKTYQDWYSNSAKKYYSENVLKDEAMKNGKGGVLLGSYAGNAMPDTLIHDGKPREKSLDMKVTGFGNYDDGQGTKGIQFSLEYTADYRVDDANAAAFAGKYTHMSGADFLKSDMAKQSLKDGKGDNIFVAKGSANVVVSKDATGAWKIVGFQATTSYDTSDFSQITK